MCAKLIYENYKHLKKKAAGPTSKKPEHKRGARNRRGGLEPATLPKLTQLPATLTAEQNPMEEANKTRQRPGTRTGNTASKEPSNLGVANKALSNLGVANKALSKDEEDDWC